VYWYPSGWASVYSAHSKASVTCFLRNSRTR
jgi:hypothetical protein